MENCNQDFWKAIDKLVAESELIIDRPTGSHHPKYHDLIYPIDYGYLKGTTSMGGDGIDVWMGTSKCFTVDAVICTVDLMKKDSEIKLLIGCTPEEKDIVFKFQSNSELMKGTLIEREWDISCSDVKPFKSTHIGCSIIIYNNENNVLIARRSEHKKEVSSYVGNSWWSIRK